MPMVCRSHVAAAVGAGAAAVAVAAWLRRSRRCSPAFPKAKVVEDITRRGLRKQDLPEEADAIVIGAGPSGLALAVLLGNFGRKVLVLEQHDRAGGGLHSFTEQGYDFETGFHYMGEMKQGQELRAIVDSITNNEVTFTNLEQGGGIYDKVVFQNDAETIGVPRGLQNWLQTLEEKFPEEQEAIKAYGRDLQACMVSFFPLMVWRTLPFEWLRRLLRPFLAAPQMKLSMPAGQRMDEITTNGKLKAVMGYLALGCLGVTHAVADWRSILGVQIHFSEGAYFPEGGPAAITKAMVKKIESQGGRVFVRARVDGLLWDQRGAVKGVVLEKDQLKVKAPWVVSSIGLHSTEKFLQEKPCHKPFLQRISTLERTHGHIFLFVGLRGSAKDLKLPSNNLWVLPGEDLAKCMDEFQADPTAPFGYVGLAFPSAKDPSYSTRHPDRCTCAVLAGDVPWDWFQRWKDTKVRHRGQDYEAFKKSFEERLLNILYSQYPQTKGRVEYTNLGTPLDTNFYLGKTQGESYGLQQTIEKSKADLEWLLPKPKVQHWPAGFLLAGQDVTGDGFAPALVSAIFASCAIEGFLPGWLNIISMLGLRGTLRALF